MFHCSFKEGTAEASTSQSHYIAASNVRLIRIEGGCLKDVVRLATKN